MFVLLALVYYYIEPLNFTQQIRLMFSCGVMFLKCNTYPPFKTNKVPRIHVDQCSIFTECSMYPKI